MLLKKLTTELIDKCYIELNNSENKIKLQKNILDPIINYIYEKLFPQFLTIIILFIIITFLSIINFCILISVYFSKKN
jgi:hypothetical protein